MTTDQTAHLDAHDLTLAYDGREVSRHLTVSIPAGALTVIIGPNACGKSTLLRAFTRLLRPGAGVVLLDGKDIHTYGAKEVARRVGLLPQTASAPEGIRARDLVARGRYPHQTWLRQWSVEDERAVDDAMTATRTTDLAHAVVDELSGGQRQRVWVAMDLAQDTQTLFLDEPTTYLDLAHQIELLELLTDLHRGGRTIVAVLHDLNQAARYATHLVVMSGGEVVAQGSPQDVLTEALVEDVFGLRCVVCADPVSGAPMVIPRGRERDAPSPTVGRTSVRGGAAGPGRAGRSGP